MELPTTTGTSPLSKFKLICKFLFLDSTHEESALIFAITTEGPWVGIKNHNFPNSNIVLPMEWNHFCFAYNNRNKSAIMVQNGRVVLNVSSYEPFDSRPFRRGK